MVTYKVLQCDAVPARPVLSTGTLPPEAVNDRQCQNIIGQILSLSQSLFSIQYPVFGIGLRAI